MDVEDWGLQSRQAGSVEGRIELPGIDGGLVLRLDTDNGEPSRAQVNAVQEFVAGWPGLRESLTSALLAYWYATANDATDVPRVPESPADLWRSVDLGEVHLPPTSPNGSRLVRVTGGCGWEPEHGLEIGVRNGCEVLYVGPYGGKGLREPPQAVEYNFADPVVQAAALANEPLSEEAFDELAMSAAAGEPAAAATSRAARPWWKFW